MAEQSIERLLFLQQRLPANFIEKLTEASDKQIYEWVCGVTQPDYVQRRIAAAHTLYCRLAQNNKPIDNLALQQVMWTHLPQLIQER